VTTDYAPIHRRDAGTGPLAGLIRRPELRHERRTNFELRPIDPQGSLCPITHLEYRRAREQHRYLKGCWAHYREAIAMAQRLAPHRVLEIGCRYTPLFPGGDRLDYMAEFRPTILHDATVAPWPVAD